MAADSKGELGKTRTSADADLKQLATVNFLPVTVKFFARCTFLYWRLVSVDFLQLAAVNFFELAASKCGLFTTGSNGVYRNVLFCMGDWHPWTFCNWLLWTFCWQPRTFYWLPWNFLPGGLFCIGGWQACFFLQLAAVDFFVLAASKRGQCRTGSEGVYCDYEHRRITDNWQRFVIVPA